MSFVSSAESYRRRHLTGLFVTAAVRWIPGAAAFGFLVYLFSLRSGFSPWLSVPALVLPPLIPGIIMAFRHRTVAAALSWLDAEIQGRQELQAAWEGRESMGILSESVSTAGSAVLNKKGSRLPVPSPGPISYLVSLVLLAVWLLFIAAGGSLLFSPDRDLAARGERLEAWAEAWAEESEGNRETSDLADRMGRLGRRMAAGEMGESRTDRALKELEEEIEQRQEDLLRDRIAESLVDDLDLDRKSAEAFRVGKKRLPSDILSELGEAITDSTILSSADRERLERLLSDPDLRDQSGRGRPELTEKLTQALEESLDTDDPLRRKLDEAVQESRNARVTTEESGGSESGGRDPEGAGDRGPESTEDSPAGGDGRDSSGGPSAPTGESGGSGRGDSAVTDRASGALPPLAAESEDNPMRLPSGGDGSASWKTVIRAYGEAGETAPTLDTGGLPLWQAEVESVIGRDDIPPGVRDYVREYFLALEAGGDDGIEEE